MKIILTFFLLALSSILTFTHAQNSEFNLKNLDHICIEINDEQNLLSEKIHQKMMTELKLKIMSSGIKVNTMAEAKAKMVINVNAIQSRLAEHRILVQMNIYENVITSRTGSVKTQAITYSDYSFFVGQLIEQTIYNKVMDEMIIRFIEKYLDQKTS